MIWVQQLLSQWNNHITNCVHICFYFPYYSYTEERNHGWSHKHHLDSFLHTSVHTQISVHYTGRGLLLKEQKVSLSRAIHFNGTVLKAVSSLGKLSTGPVIICLVNAMGDIMSERT